MFLTEKCCFFLVFLFIFLKTPYNIPLDLTTHINDTLKDLQTQINLSKTSTDTSSNPPKDPYSPPPPLKPLFKRPSHPLPADLLLKKFGFKSLLPFQEQALERLQAKTSCLVSRPSGCGKSTIYQLFTLLSEGIIVVVTKKQGFLKKRLEKINNFVSWGAINPTLTAEQQNHVFSLAKQKRIKLLFISPELLNLSHFSAFFPELLVFEDPQESINNENKAFSSKYSYKI